MSPSLIDSMADDLRMRGAHVEVAIEFNHPAGRPWQPGEHRTRMFRIQGPGGQTGLNTSLLLVNFHAPDAELFGRPAFSLKRFDVTLRIWPGTPGGGPRRG